MVIIKMENISLREFTIDDITNKVKWINDPSNNEFLHYDIPLNIDDTKKWFNIIENNPNRHDMVIEYNNKPVGVIGIININKKKGEYYITLGEKEYKRKGISLIASKKLLKLAFDEWGIEKVWLCVDEKNIPAINLYEKIGFKMEGLLKKDMFFKGEMINRCIYGILREEFK